MGSDSVDPDALSPMALPQLAIAGGLSGLVARFATHPFDTLKTQMQVQGAVFEGSRGGFASTSGAPSGSQHVHYRGVWDGALKLIRRDGPTGFYRGFGAVVFGIPFASGAYFAGYECAKAGTCWFQNLVDDERDMNADRLNTTPNTHSNSINRFFTGPTFSYVLSGIIAQSVAGIVYTPIDVVKERMQASGVLGSTNLAAGKYKNFAQAYSQIIQKEGVKGLFKGYWASNFTWWPFSVAYFVVYEHLRDGVVGYWSGSEQLLRPEGIGSDTKENKKSLDAQNQNNLKENLPPWVSGSCGFLAASVATVATHPLDLAKTRLQTLRTGGVGLVRGGSSHGTATGSTPNSSNLLLPRNASVFSIARDVFRKEGFKALFAGSGARVLAVAPGSAISFFVYESIKEWFQGK